MNATQGLCPVHSFPWKPLTPAQQTLSRYLFVQVSLVEALFSNQLQGDRRHVALKEFFPHLRNDGVGYMDREMFILLWLSEGLRRKWALLCRGMPPAEENARIPPLPMTLPIPRVLGLHFAVQRRHPHVSYGFFTERAISLRDHMDGKPLPQRECFRVVEAASVALAVLHAPNYFETPWLPQGVAKYGGRHGNITIDKILVHVRCPSPILC